MILSDSSKYKPTRKETADHSLPYCIAVAVKDGKVTPSEFTEKKLKDPDIWELLPKIKVVADSEFEKLFPRLKTTEVTITDTNNHKFTLRIDYPKGDYHDPMNEEELKRVKMIGDYIYMKKRRF